MSPRVVSLTRFRLETPVTSPLPSKAAAGRPGSEAPSFPCVFHTHSFALGRCAGCVLGLQHYLLTERICFFWKVFFFFFP